VPRNATKTVLWLAVKEWLCAVICLASNMSTIEIPPDPRSTQVQGATPVTPYNATGTSFASPRTPLMRPSYGGSAHSPHYDLFEDESSGLCGRVHSWLLWSDVFAACNFVVIALGIAFVIYLGHTAYVHKGTLLAVFIPYAAIMALNALIALVWVCALLFAVDSVFALCRMASAVIGTVALLYGIVVSVTLSTGDVYTFELKNPSRATDVEHYIMERVVPITVLVAVGQLTSFVLTKRFVDNTDDVTTAVSSPRQNRASFAVVPDD
jgi:hypothetical protein